jgi:hypothetical protein
MAVRAVLAIPREPASRGSLVGRQSPAQAPWSSHLSVVVILPEHRGPPPPARHGILLPSRCEVEKVDVTFEGEVEQVDREDGEHNRIFPTKGNNGS